MRSFTIGTREAATVTMAAFAVADIVENGELLPDTLDELKWLMPRLEDVLRVMDNPADTAN